jgi:hypothetical protein
MRFHEMLTKLGVDPTDPIPGWLLNAHLAPHEAGEQADEVVHVTYEPNNTTLYLEYE